jgi:multiple sugar transport system ATP-binding protein
MNFLPGRLEGEAVSTPLGDIPIPGLLRSRLQSRTGDGNARDVIVGIRPEHFEDSHLAGEGLKGMHFKAKVDVVESMGSELYAYFDVATQAESADLQELAREAQIEDLPKHGSATTVVARLDPASKATPGQEIELVLESSEIKLFNPDGGASLTTA